MTEPKNKKLVIVTKAIYHELSDFFAGVYSLEHDRARAMTLDHLTDIQEEILKQDNTPENRKYVDRMLEAAKLKGWDGVEDAEALTDFEIDEHLKASKEEAKRFEAALFGTDKEAEEFYFGSNSNLLE